MSDHDRLCPEYSEVHVPWLCQCGLIAKVRADEREKANGNEAYNAGYADGAADERERIAVELEERQGMSNAAWYVRHYGGRDE